MVEFKKLQRRNLKMDKGNQIKKFKKTMIGRDEKLN